MGTRIVFLALAAVSLSLASCGHKPPPPPPCDGETPVVVRLEAASRVNLGETGESLATTLRIFQLKSDTKLLEATFDDLLDRPAETLGDALLATDEIAIFPSATITRTLPRAPGVTMVAVVALFREPSGSFWRGVVKVPPVDPDHCRKPAPPPFVGRLEDNRLDLR